MKILRGENASYHLGTRGQNSGIRKAASHRLLILKKTKNGVRN
jgi:hypothetical protein